MWRRRGDGVPVAVAHTLLVQVSMWDARLEVAPRQRCQLARYFRQRYVSKLRLGSRWIRFRSVMRLLVMLAMLTSGCWAKMAPLAAFSLPLCENQGVRINSNPPKG